MWKLYLILQLIRSSQVFFVLFVKFQKAHPNLIIFPTPPPISPITYTIFPPIGRASCSHKEKRECKPCLSRRHKRDFPFSIWFLSESCFWFYGFSRSTRRTTLTPPELFPYRRIWSWCIGINLSSEWSKVRNLGYI